MVDVSLTMHTLDEQEYSKLKMCFYPESAAIVGASTNPAKFGGKALRYCLERNYRGRLYPINANSARGARCGGDCRAGAFGAR